MAVFLPVHLQRDCEIVARPFEKELSIKEADVFPK